MNRSAALDRGLHQPVALSLCSAFSSCGQPAVLQPTSLAPSCLLPTGRRRLYIPRIIPASHQLPSSHHHISHTYNTPRITCQHRHPRASTAQVPEQDHQEDQDPTTRIVAVRGASRAPGIRSWVCSCSCTAAPYPDPDAGPESKSGRPCPDCPGWPSGPVHTLIALAPHRPSPSTLSLSPQPSQAGQVSKVSQPAQPSRPHSAPSLTLTLTALTLTPKTQASPCGQASVTCPSFLTPVHHRPTTPATKTCAALS